MSHWRATYRLQLGPDLDLEAARSLLPYLDDLGVSHVYLSPIWEARAGSTHGYDVVDPAAVSRQLGGGEGLRALAGDARARGMGLLCDVVPNHMAADDANRFWADPMLRGRFFDLDPHTGRHRRFFDVDGLAGVRQEDPEVFATTHRLVLDLVNEGVVDGLRIDHPDGLADPAGYLEALRSSGVDHVWVEKILEPGEALREWPVEGTVGYEFAVDVDALLCDPAAREPLVALARALGGEARPFAHVAAEAKREQAQTTFADEVARLAAIEDVPGLADAVAALPVYRTYVDPDTGAVDDADRAAAAGLPAGVRARLLLERPVAAEWVRRFQQTTPPVTAKGVEDTAFYRWCVLLALCEVGGDPGRWSIDVAAFHAGCVQRARRFPRNLLVATTHDTKRSADVRARLLALTDLHEAWCSAVMSWSHPPAVRPDEALLVWQTLVGAAPIPDERLHPYLVKALREAKRDSNWLEPDESHEAAVLAWASTQRPVVEPFVAQVAGLGEQLSLTATLLRLTAPGIPDVYQGDELWFLALVDPDNRRPVDWAARRDALAALRAGEPATRETAKLDLLRRLLDLRRRRPEAFAAGYTPIDAGPDVVAYARGSDVLVAAAIRPGASLTWTPPAGHWHHVVQHEGRVCLERA